MHRRRLVVLMPRTVTGEEEKIEDEEAAEEEVEIDLEEEVVEEEEEEAPAEEVTDEEPVEEGTEEGIEEEVAGEEEVEVEIVEPVEEEIIVEEGTEESPEEIVEVVEVEEPETAVYLYDLDGSPRMLLSRSDRLPLLSPRGNRLLFVEPLREGLYNAVIGSLDEEEEHYLGKFQVSIFPAAWQPEGRAIEGRLLGVIVTLTLVAAGVVAIYLVIRGVWLRRKKAAVAPAEAVSDLEDAI